MSVILTYDPLHLYLQCVYDSAKYVIAEIATCTCHVGVVETGERQTNAL